jgi:hypothetical protein
MAFLRRLAESEVKRTNQRRPIIVDVASPDIKPRGVFAVDLADDETARMVARKIAAATGRRVTLRDADMIAIETVPAPKRH